MVAHRLALPLVYVVQRRQHTCSSLAPRPAHAADMDQHLQACSVLGGVSVPLHRLPAPQPLPPAKHDTSGADTSSIVMYTVHAAHHTLGTHQRNTREQPTGAAPLQHSSPDALKQCKCALLTTCGPGPPPAASDGHMAPAAPPPNTPQRAHCLAQGATTPGRPIYMHQTQTQQQPHTPVGKQVSLQAGSLLPPPPPPLSSTTRQARNTLFLARTHTHTAATHKHTSIACTPGQSRCISGKPPQ